MSLEHQQLEWAMHQCMMALGIIPDFTDWYACGDELI